MPTPVEAMDGLVWQDNSRLAQQTQPRAYGRESIEALLAQRTTSQRLEVRGAHLAGLNLAGLDLSGVDLTGANLQGADLTGADLQLAHLEGANLQLAHLENTNLKGVDLRFTNLRFANLTGAIMNQATLQDAKLNFAILHMTELKDAVLTRADLSNVSWGRVLVGTVLAIMAMATDTPDHLNWARECLNAWPIEWDDNHQLPPEQLQAINLALGTWESNPDTATKDTVITLFKTLIALKNSTEPNNSTAKAKALLRSVSEKWPDIAQVLILTDPSISTDEKGHLVTLVLTSMQA